MNNKGSEDKSVDADFEREWQRAMNALPAEWAAKKLHKLRTSRMESFGPGTKLVLGYLGLDVWDGQLVTVVRHGNTSLICQLDANPTLRIRIPYDEYGGKVKGIPSAMNIELAKLTVRLLRLMRPAMERVGKFQP